MPPKILFIIRKLTYGGASKVMAYIANRLVIDHYDISLLTYENNNIAQFITPEIYHVPFQYSPPSLRGIRRPAQIIKVREIIRALKPDLIISFLTYPNLTSILASFGMNIPVIISERGDPYANRGWFTILRDILYNFADGFVFQTVAAKNYYNGKIQNRAVVIPNLVISDDIPQPWSGNKEDLIVNVGRLELKQKRQDLLIRAFSKIADKYKKIKLVMFGDGEDEHGISQIIIEQNLTDRVKLAGVTNNVFESIKKAKMFVLTSDYEGIPNALIEAMCVGLPCISTNYSPGGVDELIKNMENGIIVGKGNVDELAAAMEYLLDNPAIAETLGRNAIQIYAKLAPDEIIKQWKNYINKILLTNKEK